VIDVPVNSKKDGDYYDSCGSCGREVDAKFRSEGQQAGEREKVHDWSIFHCAQRDDDTGQALDGCGNVWTRTTNQGAEKDRRRGIEPRWLTRSAGNRYMSVPTEQFRNNYEAVFGHS
jgi:hypothetical protein